MNPTEDGPMEVRAIRVPDSLWNEVREWAYVQGVTTGEAVRQLLVRGLAAQDVPRGLAPVRPPLKWMNAAVQPLKQRHDCRGGVTERDGDESGRAKRMRTVCEGAPCPHAWRTRPEEWLLARVSQVTAPDWWERMDSLRGLPGAVEVPGGANGHWVAIPRDQHFSVSEAFSDAPGKLVLHTPV